MNVNIHLFRDPSTGITHGQARRPGAPGQRHNMIMCSPRHVDGLQSRPLHGPADPRNTQLSCDGCVSRLNTLFDWDAALS